ncbi:MAG: hypothetical protein R2787_04065 [Saprospiraceae bacterium]
MTGSLLSKYWTELSESTRQQVALAAQSPLFNKREDVQRLIDLMISAPPTSKEAAWKAVYGPGHPPYHDGKFRHLMNYTLDLIRQTMAFLEIREKEGLMHMQLLQSMKRSGMHALMDKEITHAKAIRDRSTDRSAAHFRETVDLEALVFDHNRMLRRERSDHSSLLFGDFGIMVAIISLQQGCTKLAQASFFPSDSTIPYLEETIRLIRDGHFADNPAVSTWYASYQALSEPDNRERFLVLKECIASHARLFPEEELRDLYILALNVCIRRINASDKAYIREAFAIYQAGLEAGVFLENGHLSKFTYRNVLNIALALEEWGWAKAYLEEYRPYLPPREQEQIYTYNLATYYFRKQEYEEALTLLRDARVSETLEQFDVRRMMVRIYYDRNEIQALDSLLDSFDIYLRRHKKGGYHRKMFMNMVRIMRSLVSAKGRSEQNKSRLRKKISILEYLAEREWLLSLVT